MVNCWKKNGYPPNFKSRFSRINVVTGYEEVPDQDGIEQEVDNISEIPSMTNNSVPSHVDNMGGFTAEQLNQLSQLIQI